METPGHSSVIFRIKADEQQQPGVLFVILDPDLDLAVADQGSLFPDFVKQSFGYKPGDYASYRHAADAAYAVHLIFQENHAVGRPLRRTDFFL